MNEPRSIFTDPAKTENLARAIILGLRENGFHLKDNEEFVRDMICSSPRILSAESDSAAMMDAIEDVISRHDVSPGERKRAGSRRNE